MLKPEEHDRIGEVRKLRLMKQRRRLRIISIIRVSQLKLKIWEVEKSTDRCQLSRRAQCKGDKWEMHGIEIIELNHGLLSC